MGRALFLAAAFGSDFFAAAVLLSFAEGFGELGPDEESGRLRLLCRSAQERLSEIEKELSGRKKLYRTLGVFFGILAAVIII